jgi:nicotinate-nucleotide adenylyltransferase
VAPGLRIGLLGGSFNPAHEGHVHASATALKGLDLDYVWWLVSPQNPLKPVRGMAASKDRLAAAAILARSHPRLVVTDIESRLGTRFTIDTLIALRRRFPGICFVWLMGSDNLMQISRWRRWREIFRMVPVAIVSRPGSAIAGRTSKPALRFEKARRAPGALFSAPPPAWTMLDAKRNGVSATRLRALGPSRE